MQDGQFVEKADRDALILQYQKNIKNSISRDLARVEFVASIPAKATSLATMTFPMIRIINRIKTTHLNNILLFPLVDVIENFIIGKNIKNCRQ